MGAALRLLLGKRGWRMTEGYRSVAGQARHGEKGDLGFLKPISGVDGLRGLGSVYGDEPKLFRGPRL
jgi:hypothetical protein